MPRSSRQESAHGLRFQALISPIALFVLALGLTALAYQVPYTYHVPVGGDDHSYVHYFYPPEQGEIDYRWTGSIGTINFHNAGQIVPQALLKVRFVGYRPPEVNSPRVNFSVNGVELADFVAPRDFTTHEFALDAARLGPADWTLQILSDTWTPDNEGRTLGVLVDDAVLETAATPVIPPVLTTLFVSVATLAVWQVARRRSQWLGFFAGLAFLLICALGIGWVREWTVYLLPVVTVSLVIAALWKTVNASSLKSRIANTSPLSLRILPVVLLFGGQLLILLQAPVLVSIGALATAGFILLWLLPQQWVDEHEKGAPKPLELLILASIVLAALAMRVYRLDEIPFGIFRDEARHGLTALKIINDASFRPVFLGPPISQPGLHFYGLAGAFQLFGVSLASLRIVSALAGVLAIPALWLFVRELFGARVALVAAFGLAISSWHTTISRFAMPYAEPTVLALVSYWALWRGFHRRQITYFLLAGILIGISQYFGQTSKVLLLVAGGLVLDQVIVAIRARDPGVLRLAFVGSCAGLAAGIFLLVPLLVTTINHPEAYLARPDEVAIWNPQYTQGYYMPTVIVDNILRYLGAFNIAGDVNGRHHFPGLPLLDPIFGTIFIVGLVLLLRNLGRPEARLCIVWLGAGLLPGLVTLDAPSALRIVEAAPAAYAIGAVAAVAGWNFVATRISKPVRQLAVGAAVLALLVALGYNGFTYFDRMNFAPDIWQKFSPIPTQIALALQELKSGESSSAARVVYLPPDVIQDRDDQVVLDFLVPPNLRLRKLDPNVELEIPSRGAVVIVPRASNFWRLVSEAEPRYSNRVAPAEEEEARWDSYLKPLKEKGTLISGPNFPNTNLPSFEMWIVEK